jgi:hypothetical protein
VIDVLLWDLLGEDLDIVFPLPPRVPSFACETFRPPARKS